MMYQNHNVEDTSKPQTDINTRPEEIMAEAKRKPRKHKRSRDEKIMLENNSTIEVNKEQLMFAKLRNNAELLIAILNGNLDESADFVLADLKNVEATHTAFTRRQGDKVIACLANLAGTLDQLCDLVQGSG
ncbi:hypothetical protein RHGRI_002757 [Rhododendron griersonianum]|uniref:Uncharacterized protein n=1 Tax=Rhododendron griersonianum TaxID=479676 RepID=A0AAV6LR45_9ERIC|nr:hypothetical protein RHGRI_002757 [Rhododendron griersonianum]